MSNSKCAIGGFLCLAQLALCVHAEPSANDSTKLVLAGLAAYRTDELRTALAYWKQSLDLAPNEALARVYDRVLREENLDRSTTRLHGLHVSLRYEEQLIAADAAENMLAALDEDYAYIASQLGCSSEDRIVAVIESREVYQGGADTAAWSGGRYDGRIHVPWTRGAQLDAQFRRMIAHEMVHACLTNIPSGGAPWPTWLQEGLAQRFSAVAPEGSSREERQPARGRRVPKLENLPQDWSGLSIENARLAYSLALSAVDVLYQQSGVAGARNLLRNPGQLTRTTRELDRTLGL